MDSKNIDKAIDEYVKAGSEGGFTTGWILVASLSSPTHDIGTTDGYVTVSSDGLPHHAQLGLLKMAMDDKAAQAMLASMASMMGQYDDEDDE